MLYTFIHILAMIISMVFNTYFGTKFGLKKSKAALFSVFSLMILYILLIVIPWIESGFKVFGEQNMIKVYAFGPLVFLLDCYVFKMDFRTVSDLHAVWPPLIHGIGHFACIPVGCCYGYRYLEGTRMYNLSMLLTGTDMFPVQFFESVAALLVAAIFFFIAWKKKYKLNGRLFYIMLIVYGAQRIGWEFLRNNQKVIVFDIMGNAHNGDFGFSYLSLYCTAMILVGTVFLIGFHFIDKKKEKEAGKSNKKVKAAK